VDPRDVERAIELIFAELHRFVSEPVSQEELADVQANLVGSMPLSLESNAGVAAQLLYMERHHLGLDYLQRYPETVRAITPGQVLEASARYLDLDRLAVVVAGSPAEGKNDE
jgi:zinc protease